MYLNRYLRFLPLVAILTWFFSTDFPKLIAGEGGPISYGLNTRIANCKIYGWINFFFVQNYYPANGVNINS